MPTTPLPPIPDDPTWVGYEIEQERRLGPWVLRVWFYDPAEDEDRPESSPAAGWWWSLCFAGIEEQDLGVKNAHEAVIWIGGDTCADAADGRRLALAALRAWVAQQAEIVGRGGR